MVRACHLSAIVAGFLAGLATLVRPTWPLVAPGFAVIHLLYPTGTWTRRLVNAAALLMAFALTMAPWTARNWRITGHFVPTTLWAGPSLYDALSPDATGDSNMDFIESDGLYRQPGMSEYDNDRHYRQKAIEFVNARPGRALELGWEKLKRFSNPFPNAEQFGHWAPYAGVGLFELPVLVLAVIGLWQVRRLLWVWLFAAGPVLYFALVHVVFVGSIRYRLPAEYPLLVLTAVGGRWAAGRVFVTTK